MGILETWILHLPPGKYAEGSKWYDACIWISRMLPRAMTESGHKIEILLMQDTKAFMFTIIICNNRGDR